MGLDRDGLAARAVAARAALLSLCDSLAALTHSAPVAPASGAPATDPRRTVGAVVVDSMDFEWIVTAPDWARILSAADSGGVAVSSHWKFSRWATREECERHGIPYVAREFPGAPPSAPSRPEWVRITGPANARAVVVGGVYRVVDWHNNLGGGPVVESATSGKWYCYDKNNNDPYMPTWEPCAAPSPAAWVPKVGDKVRHTTDTNGEWGIVTRVDASGAPSVAYSKNMTASCPANEWTYIGRATSSERAAAGLPVDESAVDEVDPRRMPLRDAIIDQWRKDEALSKRVDGVRNQLAGLAADAAIAFFKAPAFDEAKERAVDREGLRVALRVAEAVLNANDRSVTPDDYERGHAIYCAALRAVGYDKAWSARSVSSFIDHLKEKLARGGVA